jgi:hypothetical protein
MNSQEGDRSVIYTLTVSGSLHDRLNRIAASNGGNTGEVLANALALYEVAIDARGQDCRVAILDTNNCIKTAIEGL